jgi:glycosyltransferase involved in cell wall biosynthesis
LWAHPRSAVHMLTYPPLARLYRSADAVVTYGPHVSAYVGARGASNVYVAPQSVDNDFWRASGPGAAPSAPCWPAEAAVRFLFVGRPAPEKGLDVLLDAWRLAGLAPPDAALVLAGVEQTPEAASTPNAAPAPDAPPTPNAAIARLGRLDPERLRGAYAACQVLVVPSVPTRTFREPWGLVVNEAMNRGLAVIATDAVGAAAGGLVRHAHNGLIVPAGDSHALSRAITRLAGDGELRTRLGAAGARDVLAFSHDAWAEGFSRAFSSLGVSRGHW